MCSVNEDDFDGVARCMEKKIELTTGTICKKCDENKADIVLRGKDPYCRSCFLAAATHKFRAALGKSKLVRPKDHVLIGFSGSQASVALLHLVQSGLKEANHKRLLFSCSVIYIDEGAILNLSSTEREEICAEIVEHVKYTNIPMYISSLERSLYDSEEMTYFTYGTSLKYVNEQSEEKLRKCISSLQSLTAKEDLLHILRNQLLLKIAKQLKCTKIFSAETISHLAVKLLNNVSLGRGSQLPLDIGFCDTRDPSVMLLRPMRDFLKKEVAFYNKFNGLQSIYIPSLGTKVSPYESIQKLTEKFVTDLQEEFPSTVSTIFRTGEKMSMNNSSDETTESCVLCQAPLDTECIESSALQSTEFSRMVSALGPSGFDNKSLETLSVPVVQDTVNNKKLQSDNPQESSASSSCDKGKMCHCLGNEMSVTLQEAASCLCYSCRLISREMAQLEKLPSEIILKLKERQRFKKMRKEIDDFLL